MKNLTAVKHIFENHEVITVQINIAHTFALVENILSYENYADIFMVRTFCKQIHYNTIGLSYEMVNENQFFHVIVTRIIEIVRQTFAKFDLTALRVMRNTQGTF